MRGFVTLFDRRVQEASTYRLSFIESTTIGFAETCSIRLREIADLPQLKNEELASLSPSPNRGTFRLTGLFKKMHMHNGLVYGIMQPGRQNPLEFRVGGDGCLNEMLESDNARLMCSLEMKDGDNALMFFLHRQPTKVTPIFHIQLKVESEEDRKESRAPDVFPILDLPDELLLTIFSHLSFEWRCCVVPAVCETFFELSKTPSYWNSLDLNSISIGSFHLFNSLKESLLPLVERLSLVEKIVLTWRGKAALVRGAYKSFSIDVEDWFHPGLVATTICSPRLGFSPASPAVLDAEEFFSPLVVNLTTLRIQYACIRSFDGNFPFHLMTMLQHLVVTGDSEVNELCPADLEKIGRLTNLRDLTLTNSTTIPSLEWTTFFEELLSEDLRTLRLPGCTMINDAHLSLISRRFPSLVNFEASHCKKISDAGLATFLSIARRLECLSLHSMLQLFGDYWSELLRERAKFMRIIRISGTSCDELLADLQKQFGQIPGEWENMMAEEFPLF